MEQKKYVTPMMECEIMKEVLPLCASDSVKSGGGKVDDLLFGGKDEGGLLEPSAKEIADFGEELGNLLW